jgi:hypothetical protein
MVGFVAKINTFPIYSTRPEALIMKLFIKTIGILLMLSALGLMAGCGGSNAPAPSGGYSGSGK